MPSLHRGDDRGFYGGIGSPRSARVWHEVTIETNPLLPPLVSSSADTGWSEVAFVYYIQLGGAPVPVGWGTASAKAPPPSVAQVTRSPSGCVTQVDIDLISSPASGRNPLEPPAVTPSIKYRYTLEFDICQGQLTFEGLRGWFPWHELYVEGFQPLARFSPPAPTPLLLIRPPQEVRGGPLALPDDEARLICAPANAWQALALVGGSP